MYRLTASGKLQVQMFNHIYPYALLNVKDIIHNNYEYVAFNLYIYPLVSAIATLKYLGIRALHLHECFIIAMSLFL